MALDRKVFSMIWSACFVLVAATGAACAADAPAAAPSSNPADVSPADSTSPIERNGVNQQAAELLLRERRALVREAMSANEDMLVAIVALEQANKDLAYRALADASGKLDVVLARDPHLKQVLISVESKTLDLESGPKSVDKALADAKSQLSKGNVQEAKRLLKPLTSEIRITTESLPMDTYPAAIKQATAQIQSGQSDQAVQLLANTLTTIVTTEKIVPLPPLKAEADVQQAEALVKADAAKNRAQALELLHQARRQLEVGKLLGYGEYKDIEQEMSAVQKRLGGGATDSGVFARLKQLLHEARGKL